MTQVSDRAVRIVFFGDSICFGQGVSLHRGWVTRISAELAGLAERLGREIVVVNSSVNGNTTRQALERMPYDVQSHGIDVLLAQFGLNDCNYWDSDRGHPRVSLQAFRANLTEIVARGRTFGARRVILNTNHPTLRNAVLLPHAALTYEASNASYNEAIRTVAAGGVELNDVERAFVDATGGDSRALVKLLLPDGLHLSEAGHDLYFETVYPAVRAAALDALEQ